MELVGEKGEKNEELWSWLEAISGPQSVDLQHSVICRHDEEKKLPLWLEIGACAS